MNDFLEVLRVQGAIIGLKIDVKKTRSLRLENGSETVTLGNEKIKRIASLTGNNYRNNYRRSALIYF